MISDTITPDFTTLLIYDNEKLLLQRLIELDNAIRKEPLETMSIQVDEYLQCFRQQWQKLTTIDRLEDQSNTNNNELATLAKRNEKAAADWLIKLFDHLFSAQKVRLVRGEHEPEYFPASDARVARIEFAHGFFSSALHEASHWCVAGHDRRQLSDFGYWYAPDGRSAAQQQAFERVEIKPQALECLFALACKRPFQVSQDNLFSTFDTSASTFTDDVYQQAQLYIQQPEQLPRDAKILLRALLTTCVLE
ncbi:elongation factor P hydroxylase [Psychrobacter sp. CAL346-MNA-CIBAN-0220]|uniref:elongation factor P hydroxylase n=1 Tax=Psychrobacter sp. CAL346-MNA-CIBAN-0220 TaxID=3140457 RepID=UPI00331F68D2